jgi:hypothetical protein
MVRNKKTGPTIVDADEVETAPLRESHNIPVQQDNGNPGGFQSSNDGLLIRSLSSVNSKGRKTPATVCLM